ncbi:hypothetical protein I551_5867, partial [Mycobacterium ulcerans str. Harvey]
ACTGYATSPSTKTVKGTYRHGAQVLATLRNTAINLHRLNGADNIADACRITALTANRRLDLLNPHSPAHKPANQQRRSPAGRGWLDGEREHGGRLDATTRPTRSQTEAA